MTIDPMNTPIFGDVLPVNPPRPIRIATALLIGNVVIAAVYRMLTAFDASFSIFLIPLALGVWFAVSVRAGRNWARTASTVLSCLYLGMLAWVAGYAVTNDHATWGWDILVLTVSAVMLGTAIRLIWRHDVNEYFGL